MIVVLLLVVVVVSVFGHPNGAGQCYLYEDLNQIAGMASRPRNGTNTVTVAPTTARPGENVTITVSVSGGDEIVGFLGTVYEVVNANGVGTVLDGKHTPGDGMQNCVDRQPVDFAITHSAPFSGKTSLSWTFTLWRTAGEHVGKLQVRVATLNGKSGDTSSQKFAIGFATITVPGNSTAPAATAVGSTAANSTNVVSGTTSTSVATVACSSLAACDTCLGTPRCIWCDTGKKIGDAVGLETSTGTCGDSCKLGNVAEVTDKAKCPKSGGAAVAVVPIGLIMMISMMVHGCIVM